jgi:hypothetical protein
VDCQLQECAFGAQWRRSGRDRAGELGTRTVLRSTASGGDAEQVSADKGSFTCRWNALKTYEAILDELGADITCVQGAFFPPLCLSLLSSSPSQKQRSPAHRWTNPSHA